MDCGCNGCRWRSMCFLEVASGLVVIFLLDQGALRCECLKQHEGESELFYLPRLLLKCSRQVPRLDLFFNRVSNFSLGQLLVIPPLHLFLRRQSTNHCPSAILSTCVTSVSAPSHHTPSSNASASKRSHIWRRAILPARIEHVSRRILALLLSEI
jgi:hypothetical protein